MQQYNDMTFPSFKFNYWLAPFSFLYGMGVRLRNHLFDWGLLKSEQYPVPVICIGNLCAGGAGKTPHIEYLMELLQGQFRTAVLSRGYKRKTKGFVLATKKSTSDDIGDEAFQTKKKFPQSLIAVDADRCEGIRLLLALPENERPEVILLDDAFQHRYVKPSLAIMLSDYHRMFYEDKLLPVGLLREPKTAVRRADIVIVTKCDRKMNPIDFRVITSNLHLQANQLPFFTTIQYKDLKPVFANNPRSLSKDGIKRDSDVLLFSGIASPDYFIEEVRSWSDKVTVVRFSDHHPFDKKDIAKLDSIFSKMTSAGKFIVVTEKDAARLINNPFVPKGWKHLLYYLPIEVVFKGKAAFDKVIIRHITDFKKNCIIH